jgi:amino acid transporter
MVVPDISLFEGGFLSSGLSYGGISFPLSAVILSFVFALSPILFTMTGISNGLRYTVAAGFIEIAFVLTRSTFFLHGGTLTIKPFEITSDRIYYVWTGLVFGILAFSGSGSSVFISRNVSSPRKNIPRAIISSYTVSGLIMVISAYSLVIFLGNGGLLPYETTPYYIGTAIASRFGISALYALIAVVVFSGFNLCTSYLNAFLNAVETASDGNLFGKRMREKVQRNHYLIAVFAATVVSITAAELYTGFFNMFVVIAGAVSLSYICVHVVLNFSIVRNTKAMGKKLSAVSIVSSFALIAALYYSVDSNLSSDPATNYIVLAAVALAASVTLIMHLRPGYFMNVSLRSNDEENSI